MAELTATTNKRSKGTKTNLHRKNIRVDLTPMVDLGFLLLTFFVFTTSMTEPKAMEILSPKGEIPRNTKESGSITILLGSNQSIYYYSGLNVESMRQISLKDLRKTITEKNKTTSLSDLMFVIKSSNTSTFKSVIDVNDEMIICGIPAGHFAESELTEKEKIVLSSLERNHIGN